MLTGEGFSLPEGMMAKKRRHAAFRKGKNNNRLSILVMMTTVILSVAVLGYQSVTLGAKKEALQQRQQELRAQIDEQKEYTKQLEEYKKYTKTKKFAEEVAKDKLGLVYSDEIVFKPDK